MQPFDTNKLLKCFKIQKTNNGLEAYLQNCYGYGDIIRGIASTSQLQKLCGEKIKAVFLIPDPKISTFIDINKLLSYFHIDVNYEIRYESLLPYKGKLCNFAKYSYYKIPELYDFYINLNVTPIDFDNRSEGNYICVWLPYDNLQPLNHPKFYFDKKKTMEVFNNLKTHVKFISYRSDMDYFIKTIRDAKFCIGYDGPGQAIAHAYKKKVVTMANFEFVKNDNFLYKHKLMCPSMIKEVTNINELKQTLKDFNIL